MILQLANIVGGALLSAPFVSLQFKITAIGDAYKALEPYHVWVGVALVILGIVGLAERVSPLYVGLSGASFPQTVSALIAGLVLVQPIVSRLSFIAPVAAALVPYKSIIGAVALLVGIGSMLFGCVLPLVCSAPF